MKRIELLDFDMHLQRFIDEECDDGANNYEEKCARDLSDYINKYKLGDKRGL